MPTVVGLGCGFYIRFEDLFVERIDKKEKLFKIGNITIAYRQIEVVIYVIVGKLAYGGEYLTLIQKLHLASFYYVGLIGFGIILIWNLFFLYWKVFKKTVPFFIVID